MSSELKSATVLSDELINELKTADTLILSAPIYNFGVPSSLKTWIDQIVRINHTFSYDGTAFSGLVVTKRTVLALAYGAHGYAEGGTLASMNYLEPYLVSLMDFLGIQSTKVFRIEGTTGDAASITASETEIDAALRNAFA